MPPLSTRLAHSASSRRITIQEEKTTRWHRRVPVRPDGRARRLGGQRFKADSPGRLTNARTCHVLSHAGTRGDLLFSLRSQGWLKIWTRVQKRKRRPVERQDFLLYLPERITALEDMPSK